MEQVLKKWLARLTAWMHSPERSEQATKVTNKTKAALHDASVRWGRSEAELIRQAIEQLLRSGADAGGSRGRAAAPAWIAGPDSGDGADAACVLGCSP